MIKIFALMLMCILGIGTVHADEDFETVENNFTMKHDKFGFTIRNYTDADYFHYEGTYKLNDIFTLGFRAADNQEGHPEFAITDPMLLTEDTWEFRPYIQADSLKISPVKNLTIQFRPRFEYRVFKEDDDALDTRDDYIRFRAGTWAFYQIGDIQPWIAAEFYNNVDEGQFEQSRYMIGANYRLNDNITFGPYIEKRLDDSWDNRFIMVATQVTVSF